jgi:solute carrier family 25 (mitochondrial phosphate transporter), member 23/24/25/41
MPSSHHPWTTPPNTPSQAWKRIAAQHEGHNDPKHISQVSRFIGAGMSGVVAQACTYPVDTLKFRVQCETVPHGERGNKLILHTAQKMWRQQRFAAFYRGLPMGLVGMFPYAAIDLWTFDSLKAAAVKRNMRVKGIKNEEDALPSSMSMAFMGGFSGALGASIVYPINLLRTRLQSQGTAGHPRTYTGIMDVTRQTIQGEGWRGLFKGLGTNLVRVVPAVSIVSPPPSAHCRLLRFGVR